MQPIYPIFLLFIAIIACSQPTQTTKENPKSEPETNLRSDTEKDYTMPYRQQKKLITDSAMVVAAHPLAAEVGRDVLKKGGNAVDAMVAVHFMLAVVFQRAGNIGGGGFLVYRDKDGKASTLDFREKAPLAAQRDMYLDKKGNPIDVLSREGHLAVGVPGSVAGIYAAHQKYGKLPWQTLLAPAIQAAEQGHQITEFEAGMMNRFQVDFKRLNRFTPTLVKDGNWKKGDLLVQKELAAVLRDIQDKGAAGFYKGRVADLIVAEMKAKGGIITHQDLENYTAKWREPVVFDYKNYRFFSMPPSSSGGLILAELMHLIEPYDIGKMGYQTPAAVHLMVEAERRAYADRAEHLGDSDFYPVPFKMLIDKNFAKQRMKDYQPTNATPSSRIQAAALRQTSEETTHYSIVDTEGNAVAVTTTVNGYFGSKVLVKGGGFILNNEMDDFSAKPGSPNMYGLLGAEANAIEPEKRMLSAMTPTIIEKDGKLFMVLGTPGGSTIITSVFQVSLNVIAFGLDLQDAVQKPRFHHQWLPDIIQYEAGCFSPETIQQLQKMGHSLKERDAIGRVDAVLVLPDGRLEGAADNRCDDSAAGF